MQHLGVKGRGQGRPLVTAASVRDPPAHPLALLGLVRAGVTRKQAGNAQLAEKLSPLTQAGPAVASHRECELPWPR